MEPNDAKIFVRGLPREAGEHSLRHHFSRYGVVLGAVVIKDRATGNPRGYGFVSFSDPSSAKEALDCGEHIILGKAVQVDKPTPRADHSQPQTRQHQPLRRNASGIEENGCIGSNGDFFRTKKIFVGGLPSSLTHEEFKRFFERFGETTDVVVMFDGVTRKPRGFGFVTFESEESVEDVMQRKYYNVKGKDVEVKRAVPKIANQDMDGSGYAEGHVGRDSKGSQGPGPFLPCYPAHGPFPGYGFFQTYGKSGAVPYPMSSYWAPYPVIPQNPCYAPAPVYANDFGWSTVVGVPNQNWPEMVGVHNQGYVFDSNGNWDSDGGAVIEDDCRVGTAV